jgi:ubiquinone/menaquinone biosynthesis C-methylase UbiE
MSQSVPGPIVFDPAIAGAAFDRIASRYDELWTCSPVGRLQREAVWRRLDKLFNDGDALLDLGCGTGEDAVHFMHRGMSVRAVDASPGMVRIARSRGVDASVLEIEQLDRVQGCFDGAMSNFGAFNCVANLRAIRPILARLIRPGGHLAVCILGRFCLWETAWRLLHGEPGKAFRRWRCEQFSASLQIPVRFPSVSNLARTFHPEFKLRDWRGIGAFVPPSYIRSLPLSLLQALGTLDKFVAHLPLLRALADHRLIVFVRR